MFGVKPFLTWTRFSVAGYLAATLLLGSRLRRYSACWASCCAAPCGILCRGAGGDGAAWRCQAAALACSDLDLLAALLLRPRCSALLFGCCRADGFTDLGINAVLPRHETVGTAFNLLLWGGALLLAPAAWSQKGFDLMRLLLQELRTIWQPGTFRRCWFCWERSITTFLSFEIQYFPNGIYDAAQLELAAEWVARYGPTIEPAELAGLATAEEAAEAFRKAVAARPECAGAGITDYESYLAYRDETYQAAGSGGQVDMEQERLIQQTAGSTNMPCCRSSTRFSGCMPSRRRGSAHLGYRGETIPGLRRLSPPGRDSVAGGWRHGFLPSAFWTPPGNCRGLAVDAVYRANCVSRTGGGPAQPDGAASV